MRASPPIEIALKRFGVWRAAVIGLVAATVGAISTWIVLGVDQRSAALAIGVGVTALGLAALALAMASVRPARLHWDGLRWTLARDDMHSGYEPAAVVGELRLAIDLGGWMLLRFVADSPDRLRAVTWLPVQRRGLEAQWHALRCAIHSRQAAPDAP